MHTPHIGAPPHLVLSSESGRIQGPSFLPIQAYTGTQGASLVESLHMFICQSLALSSAIGDQSGTGDQPAFTVFTKGLQWR